MLTGCLAGLRVRANAIHVTLLNQVTPEEDLVRELTPCEQYMEDFDGYIELVEDDSTLLRDPTAPVPSLSAQAIPPDLL